MASRTWRGGAPSVAQVDKGTPASVTIGNIFTATLTDDNGGTHAVSFTATAATVANVTAGLTAAWNASTDPQVARITAADVTTYMSFTADTAGRPFSLGLTSTDGAGSAGHSFTKAAVTATSGPNDWNVVGNWTAEDTPDAADDVDVPPGSPAIYYGLDQSGVALTSITIRNSAQIGRIEDGIWFALKVDPDAMTYSGTATLAMFDVGAWAGTINVTSSGTPTTGYNAVYLAGSALAAVNASGGANVGIGNMPDDTTTALTTLTSSAASVTVGSAVTLTTWTHSGAGTNVLSCAATTVTSGGGTLTTTGSGAVTTINQLGGTINSNSTGAITTVNNMAGTININGTGTITTLNVGGTADYRGDRRAKTVTNCNLRPGGKLYAPSNHSTSGYVTTTNGVDFVNASGDPTAANYALYDPGVHVTLTASAV